MSAIYAKTPNLGLNLYGDQDPADFRDGHNANMQIIDKDISDLINGRKDYYTKTEIDKLLQSKNQKFADAIDLGADPTGSADCADVINHAIASGKYTGISFPTGKYAISKTLDFGTCHVIMSPAAIIIATAPMDTMISTHGSINDDAQGKLAGYSPTRIIGGILNGAGLAKRCVRDGTYLQMSGVIARGATDIALDLSASHAANVSDIYVCGEGTNTVGISTNFDCQYNHIRIWACAVGILTHGVNFFNDVYIWGGTNQLAYHTYGISGDGYTDFRPVITSFYGDCLQSMVYAPDIATSVEITMSSSFLYNQNPDMEGISNPVLFDVPRGSILHLTGCKIYPAIPTRFSRDILGFGEFGSDLPRWNITDTEHFYCSNNYSLSHPVVTTNIFNLRANSSARIGISTKHAGVLFHLQDGFGDVMVRDAFVAPYGSLNGPVTRLPAGTRLCYRETATDFVEIWLVNSSGSDINGLAIAFGFDTAEQQQGYAYACTGDPEIVDGLPSGANDFK